MGWRFGLLLSSERDGLTLAEAEISRVATQYRESQKLLDLLRAYLRQIEEVVQVTLSVPSFFDLDTAVGDQLTLLGKRLGFPRAHCTCVVAPVFGFDCGGYPGPYDLVGLCEGGNWLLCRDTGASSLSLDDDDVYRRILKARRYQALGLYDVASLQEAARHIWGNTAQVHSLGYGRVVVSPGRALAVDEAMARPIAFRALPVAPGIKALTSDAGGRIFGLGDGWGGFCEGAEWLCPSDPHAYDCI